MTPPHRAIAFAAGLALATAASAASHAVMKIAVMRDGRIFMNGGLTTAAGLDKNLAALSQAGGEVWYYREGAYQDPTRAQSASIDAVLDHVMQARVTFSLSSKPDFSDVFSELSGRSVARPQQ